MKVNSSPFILMLIALMSGCTNATGRPANNEPAPAATTHSEPRADSETDLIANSAAGTAKTADDSSVNDFLPQDYRCPPVNLPEPEPVGKRRAGTVAKSARYAMPKTEASVARADNAMPTPLPGRVTPLPEFNTEEYSSYDPNRFQSVKASPLSTFGADVDTASYSIFRNKVKRGANISGLSLRTEEMINYFKYDYPEPKAGEPFSVTAEIAQCPWNPKTKLLQIGFQTHKLTKEELPPSNIVFLLDVSGSMYSEDKLPLLKNSLLNMLPDMFLRDRISVVTYASDQRLVLDGASAKYCRNEISEALGGLHSGGWTNGGRGIQMAYEVAERNFIKGGNNRVILGTDGDLNVGISSENELKDFIEKKRDTGIFLTVLGFGVGNIKDNKMEALADYGNGSYHYIDNILEARRVLVDERSQTLFVAAKDVKFQVEFNPEKIKGYRLIGYETRHLNAEDFADDTKDGGEIGAGHQVTMLYELVEKDADIDIPEVATKYQRQVVNHSDEWLTVNVRYKEPDGAESKLLSYPVDQKNIMPAMSPNMNLAAAVAEVAMLANQSEFKGTSSYNDVLKLLSAAKIEDDPYRAEFKALVEKLK